MHGCLWRGFEARKRKEKEKRGAENERRIKPISYSFNYRAIITYYLRSEFNIYLYVEFYTKARFSPYSFLQWLPIFEVQIEIPEELITITDTQIPPEENLYFGRYLRRLLKMVHDLILAKLL